MRRSIAPQFIGAGSTIVSFAEGVIDSTTYQVDGNLITTLDESAIPWNPVTMVSDKTLTGFTITVAMACTFQAQAYSYSPDSTVAGDESLEDNALVSLVYVKLFLGITNTDYDSFLAYWINQISDEIERATGGKIVLQDVNRIVDGNGYPRLEVPDKPIQQIGTDVPYGNPLASDGFASAFGTTDGLGHSQSENVGLGGSAKTWSAKVGTFIISSGEVTPNASTATIATVDVLEPDAIIDVKFRKTAAGNGGICVRYVDTSNYILAYHNGTQVKLDKVVSGVTTSLISVTSTYSASAVLRVICNGTKVKVYYGGLQVGGDIYIDNFKTSTLFGIYSTTTDVYLDDFAVYSLLGSVQYRDTPTDDWVNLVEDFRNLQMSAVSPYYIQAYDTVFPWGHQNIRLNHKAGYLVVPGYFIELVVRLVADLYDSSEQGEGEDSGSRSFSQVGASISSSESDSFRQKITEAMKEIPSKYIWH